MQPDSPREAERAPSDEPAYVPVPPYGEESLRLLVESTTDYAIFMLDPTGRIVSWNPGAERIKGYKATEIIGRHLSVFYTPDAIRLRWPWHELEVAGRTGRFEDEGWRVRKDGTRFWANVVITALRDESGALRGFGKVTRDITERKAQEERIRALTTELSRRVDELAATNAVLAQKHAENESFVFSVSHDLRSPLVNLQGFSSELTRAGDALRQILDDPRLPVDIRERVVELLDRDLAESLGFIRSAVARLGIIIDGLLRLSRAGRIEYRLEEIDVRTVVESVTTAMRGSIGEPAPRFESGRSARRRPMLARSPRCSPT